MFFELKVALKYLIPRKRSLSTALISGLSVLVISLVVWLTLVFLSVTSGIEKNWLGKLTSLYAPVRISPTLEYYNSYYYKVDSVAAASNYSPKTIGEKALALKSDPFDPEKDVELTILKQEIDPVKTAYAALHDLNVPFEDFEVSGALLKLSTNGRNLSQMTYLLSKPGLEDGTIVLPHSYKNAGVAVGDTGTLHYAGTLLGGEQKLSVKVTGFYDPGLTPVKCALVSSDITRKVHQSTQTFSPDGSATNGLFVRCDLHDAAQVQAAIEKSFQDKNIAEYWKVDTYRDFEFARDLLQQFQSDKTLFLLIAVVILIVACTNIISLLVLLVSDKRKEIAILEAMGAKTSSIAAIFGICGATIGLLSAGLGSLAAIFTLSHIDTLVSILSAVQGHAAFNPAFFGHHLPNELSMDALLFIAIATPLLSLLAGLIPAIKASAIRPSTTLRSE